MLLFFIIAMPPLLRYFMLPHAIIFITLLLPLHYFFFRDGCFAARAR